MCEEQDGLRLSDFVVLEWYVLKRGYDMTVVSVTYGNTPSYGNGSWDLAAGPFLTEEEAEAAAEEID